MDSNRRDMFITIGAVSAMTAAATAFLLLAFGLRPEIGGLGGLLFWIVVTTLAGFAPIKLSQGVVLAPSGAPLMAAMILGGPGAAAVVALLGTFDRRELRSETPWYGTLYNHASVALSAIIAGLSFELCSALIQTFRGVLHTSLANPDILDLFLLLISVVVAGSIYHLINNYLSSLIVAIRSGKLLRQVWGRDIREMALTELSLLPLAWLMVILFQQPTGWLLTAMFLVPLLATRVAYNRYAETRQHFLETISTLANAVDARDTYTHGHSNRVSRIVAALARAAGLSEKKIENIEWAGTLHDIGKIGIRDNILLKQGRLTDEERTLMNQHPVIGANILSPSAQLRGEAPIVRAHHEWFNGSGYPDGLAGEDIPLGARLMAVADSYEAMTAARPYRKEPLTHEQAVAQLVQYSSTQFDPDVVELFLTLPRSMVDPQEGPEKEVLTMWQYLDEPAAEVNIPHGALQLHAKPEFVSSPHHSHDDFHQHLGATPVSLPVAPRLLLDGTQEKN